MTKFLNLLLLITLGACHSQKIMKNPNYDGSYVLKNIFFGDVIVPPCELNNPDLPISLNLQSSKNGNIKISGKAPVNTYFGSFDLKNFDANLNYSSLNMNALGSTEMAGNVESMACESRFFDLLQSSNHIRIDSNMLYIGNFNLSTTPSRNGGTYLIFSKSSL